jgi:ATP-dependent Clp protease ATP-binding subunit ClpA
MLERVFESARGGIEQVRQFEVEAMRCGARSIEAEHMLLALAANGDTRAGKLLADAGLDHGQLASALVDEHRRALAFAGVRPIPGPDARPPEMPVVEAAGGCVSLGTSAKMALRRALLASRDARPRRARIDGVALLIGILEAELGTVPRALALAGVDRAALISRARAAVQ